MDLVISFHDWFTRNTDHLVTLFKIDLFIFTSNIIPMIFGFNGINFIASINKFINTIFLEFSKASSTELLFDRNYILFHNNYSSLFWIVLDRSKTMTLRLVGHWDSLISETMDLETSLYNDFWQVEHFLHNSHYFLT
jgi:hypothetical protein